MTAGEVALRAVAGAVAAVCIAGWAWDLHRRPTPARWWVRLIFPIGILATFVAMFTLWFWSPFVALTFAVIGANLTDMARVGGPPWLEHRFAGALRRSPSQLPERG